ncbi:MAG: GNAT family N-acetyltransferase [Oscillospiraceae bacterium]
MIREFKSQGIEIIMKLWLETNISAHSFIKSDYWKNNYDVVKESMPDALIYIYEENDVIQGFIGLMDDYIAGIFVSVQLQSKGIGKKLLDYAKSKRNKLSLNVYKKNKRAVNFYVGAYFLVSNEQVDENTGEIELSMSWAK